MNNQNETHPLSPPGETPRSNAEVFHHDVKGTMVNGSTVIFESIPVVKAEFARQLERELIEARRQADGYYSEAAKAYDKLKAAERELRLAQERCAELENLVVKIAESGHLFGRDTTLDAACCNIASALNDAAASEED